MPAKSFEFPCGYTYKILQGQSEINSLCVHVKVKCCKKTVHVSQ